MTFIVFMGTCQLAGVKLVFAQHLARRCGLRTHFIESWTTLSDADRACLENADFVVGQRLRMSAESDVEAVQTRARKVITPFLSNGFLWPFATAPHPQNMSFPFHRFGPYPAEIGDTYLNRLIAEGADPDEAVEQYLHLDVAKAVNLDRLREITLDHQLFVDEVTGFDMTPHVLRYQQEQVFRTPHHFDTAILVEMACQIARQLGLDAEDHLRASVQTNPMQDVWLPIHPSVARHFGLPYGDARQRYRYFGEAFPTFADYAQRYMRFTWNQPLHEGIHLSQLGEHRAALPKLREGVGVSPAAAGGYLHLSRSLEHCGDLTGAIANASRAVELAPADVPARENLGRMMVATGQLERAEAQARAAVDLEPGNVRLTVFLGWLLLSQDKVAEAVRLLERAIGLEPPDAATMLQYGNALLAAGRAAEAERRLKEAVRCDPGLAASHAALSHALAALDRLDEAVEAIEAAIALEPAEANFVFFLAELQSRRFRLVEAEAAHRRTVELVPDQAGFHAALADCLTKAGRHRDALPAIERALALSAEHPDYRALHEHLVHVLSA